jgi:hypothetical protein
LCLQNSPSYAPHLRKIEATLCHSTPVSESELAASVLIEFQDQFQIALNTPLVSAQPSIFGRMIKYFSF